MRRLLILLLVGLIPAAAAARQEQSCDCEAERPATLAVVNGVSIATATVEADAAPLVDPIKQQMDKLREQTLQTLITNRLVELEATKRGVTSPRLMQEEVVAKAGEPTDEELRIFYERNKASFEGKGYEELKENLRFYVRSQRQSVQMTILTTGLRSTAEIQVLEYAPVAPATAADRAKVLAIVNGSKITSGDLEDAIRNYIHSYKLKIYDIETQALDGRIDRVLIDQEAKRRNVTTEALIASDVAPKAKKVDAFVASKFYNENKNQFGGRSFADVRDDLIKFLQDQALFQARHDFAETLKPTATIKVNLVEPAPPTYAIETAGRPTLGGATAPVTIIVFSDFQCPKCATAHSSLDAIAKEYGAKVRIIARNFPLEQHAMAYKAAEAAEAAFEQGKYWEYAHLLFTHQTELSPEKLKELATQAGLDRTKFDAALESGKFASAVDRDLIEGNRVGVQGTPALYVNGRAIADDSPTGLKAAIDAALKGQA